MWAIILLAQTEVGGGAAGWTSFGIAGLVLSWLLLVHLPAKDKQIKDILDNHAALEKEQRTEYKVTLELIIKSNKEQVEGLGNALQEDLKSLQTEITALTHHLENRRRV